MDRDLIREVILNIEGKFNIYRAGFEKRYLYGIFIYYLPFVWISFMMRNNPFAFYSSCPYKTGLFLLLIISLLIHFILKNTFFKYNRFYRKFILNELKETILITDNSEDKNELLSLINTDEKMLKTNKIFRDVFKRILTS